MSIGPLVKADELFLHQVTETFASAGQSERSWTEKAWAQACAHDGSAQIDIGLGIYPNRGVVDAYAGVSKGVRQWTVRASHGLSLEVDTDVGPIGYEIVEPLQKLRFSLAPNDVCPIAFDCTFTGVVPPFLEERELRRSSDGRRVDSDILRFHQPGAVTGWLDVDGVRSPIGSDWSAGRDRSWGVRYMIGVPEMDIPRQRRPRDAADHSFWSTTFLQRSDGSRYGLSIYYHRSCAGGALRVGAQGGFEYADGTTDQFVGLIPDLAYHAVNRRLLGGTFTANLADGSTRVLQIDVLGDTGFHLGTGLYFGFDGRWHGQSAGPLRVDGEFIADCADPATARRVHQLRDCVIRVSDPVGGGIGYGSAQTIVSGAWPELGLTADSSFI